MQTQKQNKNWGVFHAKGVLDNSSGPFYRGDRTGEALAEKTIRLFIFMLGVIAAAQALNFVQTVNNASAEIWSTVEQNAVRETISQGYVGDYFNLMPPVDLPEQPSVNDHALLAAEGSAVLGVQTYRPAVAPTPLYQATIVGQPTGRITVETGRSLTVEIKVKNTGSAIWTNFGDRFIALNVTDPAGRTSPFRHPFWRADYRPARLLEPLVQPGQTGTIRFALRAPDKPGDYVESYNLVAENYTWLEGGHISLSLTVTPPPPPYQAKIVKQSKTSLTVEPGDSFTVWADAKNTGTAAWTNTGDHFIALNVTNPAGRLSAFQHENWTEYYYRPTRLDTTVVKPGEVGRFSFTLKAPLQPGVYDESFGIVAENVAWLSGGTFSYHITVSGPVGGERQQPDIRVGLYNTTALIRLTANTTFAIVDGQGRTLQTAQAGTPVAVSYSNGTYLYDLGHKRYTATQYLRFEPTEPNGVVELLSYENRPAWNTALNDNRFRGVIEIRWAEATKKLWVINELPLESYLGGLAESSGNAPPEFVKALITAARTYAYYHIQRNTKHAADHFTVDAQYDQVYRGYNFELRAPKMAENAKATAGTIATFDNSVAITPYFSRSDGRTRSWNEVWSGGPYPWLVSVSDPNCKGMTLWGHGVGMSAQGALGMASQGKTWTEILQYYYTGVTLKQIY